MADSPQVPGVWNITVWHEDPYARTFQFTLDGEPYELSTDPGDWSANIALSKSDDAPVIDTCTLDVSQAATGQVSVELPLLPVSTYYWALKPVGIRTLLAGTITVTRRVPL